MTKNEMTVETLELRCKSGRAQGPQDVVYCTFGSRAGAGVELRLRGCLLTPQGLMQLFYTLPVDALWPALYRNDEVRSDFRRLIERIDLSKGKEKED